MKKILGLVIMGLIMSGCVQTKVKRRSVKEQASLRYVQKVVEAERIERQTEWQGINAKLDEIKALLTK